LISDDSGCDEYEVVKNQAIESLPTSSQRSNSDQNLNQIEQSYVQSEFDISGIHETQFNNSNVAEEVKNIFDEQVEPKAVTEERRKINIVKMKNLQEEAKSGTQRLNSINEKLNEHKKLLSSSSSGKLSIT